MEEDGDDDEVSFIVEPLNGKQRRTSHHSISFMYSRTANKATRHTDKFHLIPFCCECIMLCCVVISEGTFYH